jgi:hypothetical protein
MCVDVCDIFAHTHTLTHSLSHTPIQKPKASKLKPNYLSEKPSQKTRRHALKIERFVHICVSVCTRVLEYGCEDFLLSSHLFLIP